MSCFRCLNNRQKSKRQNDRNLGKSQECTSILSNQQRSTSMQTISISVQIHWKPQKSIDSHRNPCKIHRHYKKIFKIQANHTEVVDTFINLQKLIKCVCEDHENVDINQSPYTSVDMNVASMLSEHLDINLKISMWTCYWSPQQLRQNGLEVSRN